MPGEACSAKGSRKMPFSAQATTSRAVHGGNFSALFYSLLLCRLPTVVLCPFLNWVVGGFLLLLLSCSFIYSMHV